MSRVVDPRTLIIKDLILEVSILNFNGLQLTYDNNSLLHMYVLEDNNVAIKDAITNKYLMSLDNSIEWVNLNEPPPLSQFHKFKIVKSNTPEYPYAIQTYDGQYIGTDLTTFLNIPRWRLSNNLGVWEACKVIVRNVYGN
jgi:hypothetical protein